MTTNKVENLELSKFLQAMSEKRPYTYEEIEAATGFSTVQTVNVALVLMPEFITEDIDGNLVKNEDGEDDII